MIVLYQFAWSPYCIVQRRILEYAGEPFRTENVSLGDRRVIWRLTRERYYQVPVLKHGRQVIFEVGADSQVLAKYLDSRFALGLFPREWEGVQDLLWRYFENDVEDAAFRLNDIYWREFVPVAERCAFVRHKERRYGRGCLEQWQQQQAEWLAKLEALLIPAEQMLLTRPHLLCGQPVFVDFCLYGMIANFLFSGHYKFPATLPHLGGWYRRMQAIQRSQKA